MLVSLSIPLFIPLHIFGVLGPRMPSYIALEEFV